MLGMLLCAVLACGVQPHPSVHLIYVNRAPDPAITAGVGSIVADGYLDAAGGRGTLTWVSSTPAPVEPWGALETVPDAALRPLVDVAPDTITLFILADGEVSVPPDASCGGCLVSGSYHQVTNEGIPYGVVGDRLSPVPLWALGYPQSQPIALFDAAHELAEAEADRELADPCMGTLVQVGPLVLPAYRGEGC